jgi:hypothetical protein
MKYIYYVISLFSCLFVFFSNRFLLVHIDLNTVCQLFHAVFNTIFIVQMAHQVHNKYSYESFFFAEKGIGNKITEQKKYVFEFDKQTCHLSCPVNFRPI